MIKRSFIATAIAAAATALAVLGTGGAAQADDSVIYVYEVGGNDHAGEMQHVDDGDEFRIYDLAADGHGVRGTLLNADFVSLKSSYNGNGSDAPWANYTHFAYNILSGKTYYMRICIVDGASDTTPLKCATQRVTE